MTWFKTPDKKPVCTPVGFIQVANAKGDRRYIAIDRILSVYELGEEVIIFVDQVGECVTTCSLADIERKIKKARERM